MLKVAQTVNQSNACMRSREYILSRLEFIAKTDKTRNIVLEQTEKSWNHGETVPIISIYEAHLCFYEVNLKVYKDTYEYLYPEIVE